MSDHPYDPDQLAEGDPPPAQPRDDGGRFASPNEDLWGRRIEWIDAADL